jgi:MerR family transcriptional regulator, light-induced transcriptional regulator
VLVGLPPGSRHELGALAFATAARRAGLAVLYLGRDLRIDDWVRAAGGVTRLPDPLPEAVAVLADLMQRA